MGHPRFWVARMKEPRSATVSARWSKLERECGLRRQAIRLCSSALAIPFRWKRIGEWFRYFALWRGCGTRVFAISIPATVPCSLISIRFGSRTRKLRYLVAPLLLEIPSVESAPSNPRSKPEAGGLIEIPVCYDGEFAPDLGNVARHSSLAEEQVIALHSGGDYFVYFLGFAPGFAYLGGLAGALHVPRLVTPRKQVSAGSVGIGGAQTGIYPNDSPGGWQLIGRTPLRMFDASSEPPSRLQPGDRVRFRRIDRGEFDRLAQQQERGR